MTWRRSMIPLYLSSCHSLLPVPHFLMFKISLFDWFQNLKKKTVFFWKRECKIATFPTFSAVRSVRTFCSYLLWQNQYTKSFCKRTPKKLTIWVLTFTLLKQLSTNKQFVETHDSPSLAEAHRNVNDNIITSIWKGKSYEFHNICQ